MSIFFSPDEPKVIDIHSGRVTRFKSHRSSMFSREKDNTLNRRVKSPSVVAECVEMKHFRMNYLGFCEDLNSFFRITGSFVLGPNVMSLFTQLKASMEPFLLHCSHFFHTSPSTRKIGKYSPIIEFTVRVLREWSSFVVIINELASSESIPHVDKLNSTFIILLSAITTIHSIVSKKSLTSSNNSINRLLDNVTKHQKMFLDSVCCISQAKLYKEKIIEIHRSFSALNHSINDVILASIPSHIVATPEMTRLKTVIKASCGEIIFLFESSLSYRKSLSSLLQSMKLYDVSLRQLLTVMNIGFRLDIEPSTSSYEDSSSEDEEIIPNIPKNTSPPEIFHVDIPITKQTPKSLIRTSTLSKKKSVDVESIINEFGDMLKINLDKTQDIQERIAIVKKRIRETKSNLK